MKKEKFLKKLSTQISKVRKEKKLSQVQLAKLMNLPQQNISRLESGRINPSVYSIHEIAVCLKVSITDLLDF